jgi:hypothetical protein
VQPDQVVVCEGQDDSRMQVFQLLAESVGQAGNRRMLIRIVKF